MASKIVRIGIGLGEHTHQNLSAFASKYNLSQSSFLGGLIDAFEDPETAETMDSIAKKIVNRSKAVKNLASRLKGLDAKDAEELLKVLDERAK